MSQDHATDWMARALSRAAAKTVKTAETPEAAALDAPPPLSTDDEAAALQERAAIIAEGSGAPYGWAEAFATLDRSQPVAGYSPGQWRQLIDDGGRFLDEWGAEAARLGWRAVDVFGVVRSLGTDLRPRDEVGQRSGLVPLISGGRVTSIGPDRATITMPTGTASTYYLRRPVPGAVAIWEIATSRGRAA
jgi:hypothetical protein